VTSLKGMVTRSSELLFSESDILYVGNWGSRVREVLGGSVLEDGRETLGLDGSEVQKTSRCC
jgi:hypothetical protein